MAYYGAKPALSKSNIGTLAKDTKLSKGPDDSISCVSFSPRANHLSVSSWDGKVRIYDVSQKIQGSGIATFEFGGPVLATDWAKDGRKVVGCSTDKTAKIIDLGENGSPAQQVAAHDSAIRSAKFVEVSGTEVLVTGSWDKTIRYWDMRTPNPVCTLPLSDKVYAMDSRNKLLVVALADLQFAVINLDNPGSIYNIITSPLKHQTRAVSCLKEADGFVLGTIEARCAVHYLEDKQSKRNMSFKCHREESTTAKETKCWAVNAISIHPKWGTFSTAGSDGTFNFWDMDSRSRLKGYPKAKGSISSTAFNHDGTLFAYAVSYDWHKGYAENSTSYPTNVMIHAIDGEEVKSRPSRR